MVLATLLITATGFALAIIMAIWQVKRARRTVTVEPIDQGEHLKINVRNRSGSLHEIDFPTLHCRKWEVRVLFTNAGGFQRKIRDRGLAEAAIKRDQAAKALSALAGKTDVPIWLEMRVDGRRTVKSARLKLS